MLTVKRYVDTAKHKNTIAKRNQWLPAVNVCKEPSGARILRERYANPIL